MITDLHRFPELPCACVRDRRGLPVADLSGCSATGAGHDLHRERPATLARSEWLITCLTLV
jgi:hypothetical protein